MALAGWLIADNDRLTFTAAGLAAASVTRIAFGPYRINPADMRQQDSADVSTLLASTVDAWRRRDDVVASVGGRGREALPCGDRAADASGKPSAIAKIPTAATVAVGTSLFTWSRARATIAIASLLRWHPHLPIGKIRIRRATLFVRDSERSSAGAGADPTKSRHFRKIIAPARLIALPGTAPRTWAHGAVVVAD